MRYWQRKFPVIKHKIQTLVVISISILFILLLLEPVGFDLYKGNKFLASFGFGLITFAILCIFNYILKKYITRSSPKWTILHELIYLLVLIMTVSLFNYGYITLILIKKVFSIKILLYVIIDTFIIALIPSVILTLIKYNKLINEQLNSFIDRKEYKDDINFSINTNTNKHSTFSITLNSFIFAESDRNNINIYYLDNNILKSKTIRTSISTIQEELNHYYIFRCHRSYIININKIESSKGNSNGYLVKLMHYDKEISVSRKYVNDLREYIY